MAVQVFAVQVGEQAIGIARVLGQQALGFVGFQHKADPAHVIADKRLALVLLQAHRLGLGVSIQARRDGRDGLAIEHPYPWPLSHLRREGFLEGDQVDLDAGLARPLDEASGEGDVSALRQDDLQAAFAGVALADGVGSDQAQPAAGAQQGEGAPEESRAQVGRAAEGGKGRFQPFAIPLAKGATDLQAAHEGRVAQDHIEARGGGWRMANG